MKERPIEDAGWCVPRAAEGRLGLLLVNAGHRLTEIADDLLADADLDGRAYTILSVLDTDGPGSQNEIARLIGKAPAIVVGAIDDLERRGLVERTRDPADRRRSRVTLTEGGRTALAKADRLSDDAVASLLDGLGAEELTQLRELLERGLQAGLARASRARAA